MTTDKVPLELDEFLAQHGKDKCVIFFSREAISQILVSINRHNEEGNAPREWRSFFKDVKEVWSEGVIIIPRDKLKLSNSDIERLDEIKQLKSTQKRCSELVYEVATSIAHANAFTFLSKARFLIPVH